NVLKVLKIFVDRPASSTILPHPVSVPAQKIFGPHEFDAGEVRVLIQLSANGFQRRNVTGGQRVRATIVKLLKVQFVLNTDGIETDVISVLKAVQRCGSATSEWRQRAGWTGAAHG